MITHIRKKNSERFRPDALDLMGLLADMDKHQGTLAAGRVEKILKYLSELRTDMSGDEKRRVITGLRIALEPYRWVRWVHFYTPKREFSVITGVPRQDDLSDEALWEQSTVGYLLGTIPYLGKRPRIRRCEDAACNGWFFAAKRDDQKFCSGKCKQHAYESLPENAENKRKRMREHYATLKDQRANPKSGIGLERGKNPLKTSVSRARLGETLEAPICKPGSTKGANQDAQSGRAKWSYLDDNE